MMVVIIIRVIMSFYPKSSTGWPFEACNKRTYLVMQHNPDTLLCTGQKSEILERLRNVEYV